MGLRYNLPPAYAQRIRFRQNDEMGTACWIWTGAYTPNGTPRDTHGHSTAAQAIWEHIKGEKAKDILRSLCNVRQCVNPGHRFDIGKRCPTCFRYYP